MNEYCLIELLVLDSNTWNSCGSARGVMVIVVGNRHGNMSSNPGPS